MGNQELRSNVVHSLGCKDDIGSWLDNQLKSFQKNLLFLLSDLLEIFGIADQNLNSHGQSELA